MPATLRNLLVVAAALAVLATTWWLQPSGPPAPETAPSSALPSDVRSAGGEDAAREDPADLQRSEAMGGHTIERHVGKSDEDLAERLRRQPRISAASTYRDLETAQRVVGETIMRNEMRITEWLEEAAPGNTLTLRYRGREAIGRGLERGRRGVRDFRDAIVVLRKTGDGRYFVLTSYPDG